MIIRLRKATVEQDWARLFVLRNDPGTREGMLSTDEVPLREHMDWLRRTVGSKTVHLFVAEDPQRGLTLGTARLDLHKGGNRAEVSVTVDPRQRGRGSVAQVLDRLREAAEEIGVNKLVATVKTRNGASLRAFATAGYVPTKYRDEDGLVDLEREVRP